MNPATIEQDFRAKVCAQIQVEAAGREGYRFFISFSVHNG